MKTRKITDAYKELLYILFFILVSAGLIAASSFAIVTPMWIAATRFKSAFTLLLFTGAASYIAYNAVTGIRKKRFSLKYSGIFITKLLLLISAAVLLLSSILLFKNGIYLQGILIIGTLFLISGLFRFFNI